MLVTNEVEWSAQLQARLAAYDVEDLGDTLVKAGVVQMKGFLPEQLRADVTGEAEALLRSHGKRVNVLVPSTGKTPRKYVSVARNDVFANAPLIAQLYFDQNLIDFLKQLTRSEVIGSPYEPEQIVVNQMNEVGDTHGWHWDDYSYSLVMVLEAPASHNGAQVEYVDGTSWDKSAANVQHYVDTMPVKSLELEVGCAYLLLGKRAMHRVSPLLHADTRKIVCFSYATEEERFIPVDHGSMEDIYG